MIWWIIGAVAALFVVVLIIAEIEYNSVSVCKNRAEIIEDRKKLPPAWDKRRDDIKRARLFIAENAENVCIRSYDGLKLCGNLLRAEKPTANTVIAVHGYKMNGINEFALYVDLYRKQNVNLLIIDLRGHGNSEGKYITFGYKDKYDCVQWCEYVTKTFGQDSKIILHGISMGGATVMMTAAERPCSLVGVISDCGFTDTWDIFSYLIRRDYKINLFPILRIMNIINKTRNGFSYRECSAKRAIANADVPFLFIHGDADRYVPVSMVYEVYNACVSKKTLYIAKGAAHGASYLTDEAVISSLIVEFMHSVNICT